MLPEEPGAHLMKGHLSVMLGSGQGIGRSVVRLGVQEGQWAQPAPCHQPTWGLRDLEKRMSALGGPWGTRFPLLGQVCETNLG